MFFPRARRGRPTVEFLRLLARDVMTGECRSNFSSISSSFSSRFYSDAAVDHYVILIGANRRRRRRSVIALCVCVTARVYLLYKSCKNVTLGIWNWPKTVIGGAIAMLWIRHESWHKIYELICTNLKPNLLRFEVRYGWFWGNVLFVDSDIGQWARFIDTISHV